MRSFYVILALGLLSIFHLGTASSDAPLTLKSSMCGAAGDGVADDTAAIQKCVDYARAEGAGDIYAPRGSYRVTKSINLFGDGIHLRGAGHDAFGRAGTIILDELTEPYAVMDFSGCMECSLSDLTISTNDFPNHSYKGTQSTSGVLVSPGPVRPIDGGFHFLLRDVDVLGSGMCSGCAAVAIVGSDWPVIENYLGGPVVMGYSLGRSNAVNSKFYDITKVLPDGNPTMDSIEHAQLSGDYVPALQLTGSQYYVISDIDASLSGGGSSGVMVEVTGHASGGWATDVIHAVGLRTENFSASNNVGLCKPGASPVPMGCGAVSVSLSEGRSTGGSISGQFCGDPLGHVLRVADGAELGGYATIADYCEAMPFFLIGKKARLWNDTFRIGQGLVDMGMIDPTVSWQQSNVVVPAWERFDLQRALASFPAAATGMFGSKRLGQQ